MTYYPATLISLDSAQATVRIDDTGQIIQFPHDEHYAVPVKLREVGKKGAVSFPKAPPIFGELASAAGE
jgi:hypothetical protein